MNPVVLNEIITHLAAAFSVGLVVALSLMLGMLLLVTGRPISRLPNGLYGITSIFAGLLAAVGVYPFLPSSIYALLVVVWSFVAVILVFVTTLALRLNAFKDYTRRLKGLRGERQVMRRLAKLGYPARHECYVGTKGERVAQVDHLALVGNRVVVIETKNYFGDIAASDGDAMWTLLDEKGVARTSIGNPLRQNEGHVRAVREAFGIEPIGLVVMTELSTFTRGVPRGVVQLRNLDETLEAIAARPGDRSVAEATWNRICSYLDEPGAPTRKDHAAYLTWLRVGTDGKARTSPPPGMPPASCGKCRSGNVRLGYGWSHYWRCNACKELTHIEPHPADVPGELDPVKAFAGRGAGLPSARVTRVEESPDAFHIGSASVARDKPGASPALQAEEDPVDTFGAALPSMRWPGHRKPASSPDVH